MNRRLLHTLLPLLGLILFGVALFVLSRALQHHHLKDIVRQIEAIPRVGLAAALVLTILDYLTLTGFDTLALHYAGRRLAYRRTALASFISYAFSHNVGLSFITSVSVRYRLYSTWGLTALEIAKVSAFCGMTFWVGYLALAGAVFLVAPPPTGGLHLPVHSLRVVGAALLLILGAIAAASLAGRRGLRIRGQTFKIPDPKTLAAQIVVSTVDWTLAGSVLFAVLPAGSGISWPEVQGAFLVAQFAGLVSNVPGGLGVFETVVLVLLGPVIPAAALIGSLVTYRVIYYLLPLGASALLLGAHELAERREGVGKVARAVGRWAPQLAPPVLGFATFLAGLLLLLSGATPAAPSRLAFLRGVLPLPLLEASHFLASLVGAALLLLARGLQRRLDAAWWLAMTLLMVGIGASLLKGLDWEEALILALVFAALAPCHRHFYRGASLIRERFSPAWGAAVVLALGSAFWLTLFAHKHVEFSSELWWRFAVHGEAPRSLRALVGALALTGLFALARLLTPAPPRSGPPRPEDRARVRAIVAASPHTLAQLALLGDKQFLFSASGAAFVMYGVKGRSFVALGDPVGVDSERTELAWQFRDLCDRHGAWPAFYQVGPESLPLYLDLGLTPVKLGEEARVPLQDFSLEGHSRKWLRHVVRRSADEGLSFTIAAPEELEPLLPRLRQVSDIWLATKRAREKRFSLGCFDETYLKNFSTALVRSGGEVVAFANVWIGGDKEELSVDLMRYTPGLPPVLMDFLFVELMLWGRREGHRWFNLGVCPLAGLESRRGAPFARRLGALLYRHGENFYNFQGLRQYKEKFEPEWTPVYLACPGGLILPRVAASIAALVSGGLRGAVTR